MTGATSPHQKLEELEKYIEDQIDVETSRPSYNGLQRAVAYGRVLRRLRPILRQIRKIQREFNFSDLNEVK